MISICSLPSAPTNTYGTTPGLPSCKYPGTAFHVHSLGVAIEPHGIFALTASQGGGAMESFTFPSYMNKIDHGKHLLSHFPKN